ncbi:MAG: heme ABC transporter ATP-binding protein [Polaromonas sp.]|nr:heme ABC transporter ATP-binding protein [Polaromonas sp.]
MNARHEIDLAQPAGLATPATGVSGAPDAASLTATGAGVRLQHKTLLQATSAEFQAGQVTVILGPNGAGKSTFMSLLTGQRAPSEGQVRMAGRALQDCPAQELARYRAFVAQETQVAFDFTVREVVELGRYPHRRRPSPVEIGIPDLAMQATAVEHLADRPLNTLSGGEKARVHLARALAQVWESPADLTGHRTRWLLLDEPTAALDLRHQHRMLLLARRWADVHGVGVVAVLHDLNLALRYSDRCLVLQDGQLVASGLTGDVLTPQRISDVWDVVAHPVSLPAVQPEACGLAGKPPVRQYLFEARAGD